jgi:anti-sigma B factor antagonist
MDTELPKGSFDVKRHGDLAIIIPSANVENMPETLIQPAAEMVLAPLRKNPPSGVVIDLSQVKFFGSAFISFLLKCHLLARTHGYEVVLAGASERIRELLNVTNLNTLWALYDSPNEALEALGGSD